MDTYNTYYSELLCGLAAADAGVGNDLLLQGQATGANAGGLLDLVLAGLVAAPHSLDEAIAVLLQSGDDLVHGLAGVGFLLAVGQSLVVDAVISVLAGVFRYISDVTSKTD